MADPLVFALVNPKGGVGKSTLAMLLAYSDTFAKAFPRIALVETDPQGSLKTIHEQRAPGGGVEFHHVISKSPGGIFEGIAAGVDAIIIDVPGESVGEFATRFALAAADLVIVPVRVSEMDINAANENLWPAFIALGAKGVVVPAFLHPQAKAERSAAYLAEWFPERVPVLPVGLPSRGVYQVFPDGGRSLIEHAKTLTAKRARAAATKAIEEVEVIAKEIIRHAREKV